MQHLSRFVYNNLEQSPCSFIVAWSLMGLYLNMN